MPILSLQNVIKDYCSDGQLVRALHGLSLPNRGHLAGELARRGGHTASKLAG